MFMIYFANYTKIVSDIEAHLFCCCFPAISTAVYTHQKKFRNVLNKPHLGINSKARDSIFCFK